MKLICFPHAGGFAGFYSFLKKADIKGIDDVRVYEYPGRGIRYCEKPMTNLNLSSEIIANELRQSVRSGEFVLFGHSMGAFLAYETALTLQNKYGLNAKMVFISGQKPPATFKREHYIAENDEILMAYLIKLGGIPDILLKNKNYMKQFLTLAKQDIKLLLNYNPSLPERQNRLERAAVLYGGEDPEIDLTQIHLWSESVKRICGMKEFVGSHFYLDGNQDEIIRFMNKILMEN